MCGNARAWIGPNRQPSKRLNLWNPGIDVLKLNGWRISHRSGSDSQLNQLGWNRWWIRMKQGVNLSGTFNSRRFFCLIRHPKKTTKNIRVSSDILSESTHEKNGRNSSQMVCFMSRSAVAAALGCRISRSARARRDSKGRVGSRSWCISTGPEKNKSDVCCC